MDYWRPALAPAIVLRRDPAGDGDLLVMPERVVTLSGQAGAILRLCDGQRSVVDIIDQLERRFPGAPVRDDVPEFLHRVKSEGWVR